MGNGSLSGTLAQWQYKCRLCRSGGAGCVCVANGGIASLHCVKH